MTLLEEFGTGKRAVMYHRGSVGFRVQYNDVLSAFLVSAKRSYGQPPLVDSHRIREVRPTKTASSRCVSTLADYGFFYWILSGAWRGFCDGHTQNTEEGNRNQVERWMCRHVHRVSRGVAIDLKNSDATTIKYR